MSDYVYDGGDPPPSSGTVNVQEPLSVDDGGGSLTVDASSLPLPSGAATAANQTAENTKLDTIHTDLGVVATAAKQDTGNTSLATIATNTTGVATAAKQDTGNTSLGSIDTKLSSQATAANQSTGNTSLASIDTKLSSQATAANQSTGNTSLATIATNTTGVATAANQSTGNTSLATIATNTTGVATAANQSTANTSLSTIATNTTGVATAANQTSSNTKLDTLHTDLATTLHADVGPAAGLFTGKTTVTTAGTKVALGTTQALKKGVKIRAATGNTGLIYVGDSTVSSSVGYELAPGECTDWIPIADRNTINLDASVNSQSVTYIAL